MNEPVQGHRFFALEEEQPGLPGPDCSSADANHRNPAPTSIASPVGFQAADDGGTGANGSSQPPSRPPCCLCGATAGPFMQTVSGQSYCFSFAGCDERRGVFNSTSTGAGEVEGEGSDAGQPRPPLPATVDAESYDPVGHGYPLGDPKSPDAPRWA